MSQTTHQPPNPSPSPAEGSRPQPKPRFAGARSLLPVWRPREYAELFAVGNLAFLALDVYLAHSINRFAEPMEWIPIAFSGSAVLLLLIAFAMGGLTQPRGFSRALGLLVGGASLAVGIAGLLLHLNSQFFEQATLKSLVYTAPFVAPLAYAGLGLLLLLNRMVNGDSAEWAGWVILLAAGGSLGNFILSLADHAQNGFYVWSEWVPVVASAFATAFLVMPLLIRIGRGYLLACGIVMVIQFGVGLVGFTLHVLADFRGPASHMRDNFLYGAPAFAPLLFPNIAVLAGLGLWAMAGRLTFSARPGTAPFR